MSLLSFAQSVQSTDFFTAMRGSAYVYPLVLTIHLIAIALFGGMILLVDVRLLGWAMRKYTVSELVNQLRPLKWAGFLILVTCGLLMAGCKAEEYYYNVFFRTKMTLLLLVGVHALIFHRGVYGNTAELDAAPRIPAQAKLAGALSLILWTALVIAGRGIGYIEPPLDKIHARLFTAPASPLLSVAVLGKQVTPQNRERQRADHLTLGD
jgi:hypothetical protein